MSKRTYRSIQTLLFLMTALVLFSSFYFQYFQGLEPCPLCIMQRVCIFFLFMFCLMGMSLMSIHRGRIVACFQLFFSGAGLFFAGRQLWLQSLPSDQVPACLPGLEIMMKYFPWRDIIHALIWGAGDCAEISWSWLGISMPGWAALYFLTVFVVSAFVFWALGRTLGEVHRTR